MRFLALLRKELRESLPWMLLAAIIFLAIGGFVLRAQAYLGQPSWYYSGLSPGTVVDTYRLTHFSPLRMTGSWLLVTSIGLGLALGVRHFWMPLFTRTWPFLIHRSANRPTILWAKLAAAIISFIIPVGVVWVALYRYSCRPEIFETLPTKRVFIEGWLFILLGLVAYLGTALAGLSSARWYTTKILGLAFATIVICMTIFQWRLGWAFAVLVVGVVVLLSQIIDAFLNREF
ncbi:MAG TPA: hypothetical protein HPP66_02630 [Planctomycetes bacterium]|nr:hypothetical protein [Planctomycetota bacterium]